MDVRFDTVFLHDLLDAEAAARGMSSRLNSLVVAREADGLDEREALFDAADSLGVMTEIREAIAAVTEPLAEQEVVSVLVEGARGTMPTLRRTDQTASAAVEPAPLVEVLRVLRGLVQRMLAEEDRTAVTLPVGLGGSGGCACGDDLPEDRAPGPLFIR